MRRPTCLAAILALLVWPMVAAPAATRPSVRRGTPAIQTIYLVYTSHWDYGFTDPPQNFPALVRTHLNDAVAKCLADPRHRYTIESIWVLEDYLAAATPAEADTLLGLIRQGRIALSSAYTSPHSGIMSPEELNRWTYRAERLRRQHQLPIRTALVNDNPGYEWAMPDALSGAGVDRLVCGPNTAFASDFPLPRSESIFRWEGPGGGRTLTWVSRDAYLEGASHWQIDANVARFFFGAEHPEWAGWTNQQIMEQGITEQVSFLESEGYPYDSVLVLMAFDKMDYDPSGSILADIETWNATHASPQIRLATADEFFDHMTATYGLDAFPVRRGNWTQRWERTKIYSQTPQSRFRELRDSLSAAEMLSTIGTRFGAPYPTPTIDDAYRDLMRFDCHGGRCGGTQAGLMTLDEVHQTNLHWMQTSLAHRDAVRDAIGSSLEAIGGAVATGSDLEILVFNSLSSARTDVVRVPLDLPPQPLALRDAESGDAVPFHRHTDGSVEFVAESVPPIGYRRYRVLEGVSDDWANTVQPVGSTIESPFYRVTIDPATGAIASIVDKTAGNRELVNGASQLDFNRTVKANNLTDFLGGAPSALQPGTPTITARPGVVSGTLEVQMGNFGGPTASPLARIEVRLYDRLPRIDIVDTFDRARLFYVVGASQHSEHFYAPMPFNIATAQLETRVDASSPEPLRPPTETYLSTQTTVAVNNSHTPSRGIVLRDRTSQHEVQVVSPQVYSYLVGATLNSYSYAPTEATLMAECMVKQDRTITDDPGHPERNFILEPHETIPGIGYDVYTAQFSITSGTARTDVDASRFGAAVCAPLRATVVAAGQVGEIAAPTASLFGVDAPNVEILTVKRADFGDPSDTIVRVRERGGTATNATLTSAFPIHSVAECTLLETPTAMLPGTSFAIGPYQTKTLRLALGAFAGREADTAGIYAPATGTWFLKNTNAPGPADLTVGYGPPNWVPVVGDWNGDGIDTLGVYDPATSNFFLKNSILPGPADLVFQFGPPASGWIPLAGDWDGDGVDTVALYAPASGTFFLNAANTPGPAALAFGYGPPNATPVAGDWDGDGVDTIGIYQSGTGVFFLKNENASGVADVVYQFGAGGQAPLAGDWNGDGIDTPGLYVAATGFFFLRDSNAPGVAHIAFNYGAPNAAPLAGNWDGT